MVDLLTLFLRSLFPLFFLRFVLIRCEHLVLECLYNNTLIDLASYFLARCLDRFHFFESFPQTDLISASTTSSLSTSASSAAVTATLAGAVHEVDCLEFLDDVDESLADGRLVR